jgi:hypothetical protein
MSKGPSKKLPENSRLVNRGEHSEQCSGVIMLYMYIRYFARLMTSTMLFL